MADQTLPMTTKAPQSVHVCHRQVLNMALQIVGGCRIGHALDHFLAVGEWHNGFANLEEELLDASSDVDWKIMFL